MILGLEKTNNKDKNIFGPYLSHEEFKCKCEHPDCSFTLVDPRLVEKFTRLREKVGFPLIVNSGYRCQKHNSDTPGSAKRSRHMRGQAIDIQCPKGYLWERFVLDAGIIFDVVIPYQEENFVHCHVNPSF